MKVNCLGEVNARDIITVEHGNVSTMYMTAVKGRVKKGRAMYCLFVPTCLCIILKSS